MLNSHWFYNIKYNTAAKKQNQIYLSSRQVQSEKPTNSTIVVNLNLQCVIYKILSSRMIYNKCNSRISLHSWGSPSQTVKQWKHSCSFVTKTYGTDQEECVSVLNHSDKPNEFPRSTEWVFVLFWERGLEFLSKSLQQWWVWKWSTSFEMKGEGGYSVCTSL